MARSNPKMVLRSETADKIEDRNIQIDMFFVAFTQLKNEVEVDEPNQKRLARLYAATQREFHALQQSQAEVMEIVDVSEREGEIHQHEKICHKYRNLQADYREAMGAGGEYDDDDVPLTTDQLNREDGHRRVLPKPTKMKQTGTRPKTAPSQEDKPLEDFFESPDVPLVMPSSPQGDTSSDVHQALQFIMTEMRDMKLQMLKSENSRKTGRSHEVSNITEDEQDHQMKTQGRARFQDIDSPSPTPVSLWETRQNLAYPSSPNSLASNEMVKKPPTQPVDSPLKTESWLGDRGPSVPGHLGAQATYKLPTLEVPTFSGESSKQFFEWWPSFRDVYQQNPGLDSASKLAYLKRHLRGRALQVASSHSTYDDAIGNLHQIYGKERDLLSEMTIELDQLKEKNVNLLDLLLAVNSYVALFKLIDQDSRQLAALLIQPIEHKLPMEVLLQWRVRVQTMDKCGEPVLISDFSQFLIDSINLYDSPLVRARTTQQKKERKSEKLAAPQQARRPLPAEPKSTLMFNAVGSMQYKKCPFCQGKPHVEVRNCRKVNAFPPGTIKQLAQTNHLCYMCLTHHGRENCSAPRCKKCNGAHHALLHMDYYDRKENVHPGNQRAARRTPVHSIRPRENPWNSENQKSQQQRPPSQEDRVVKRDPTPETPHPLALTSLAPKAMESVLPVLELKIKGPDGHSMGIYALLDSGCTTSFIKRSLASALGLRGSSVSLQIQTLGNNLTEEKNHELVNFTIENATASLNMTAATIKTICSDIRTINYTTEENINMACPRKTGKVPISLLIGVDYLGEIYGTHRTSTKNGGLSLISTKFGHCLMGSTSKQSPPHRGNQSNAMQTVTVMMGKTSIEQDLEKLWTLEAMGILDQEEEKWTASELQAVQHFQQNTKLEGKRYEVSLPFSEPTPPIENNFIQALKCLEALERRWSRDAEFAAAYKNAMEEYFEQGYAHVLPNDELKRTQGVFYLPHSAVKREESTSTKMRIVFNASAVYKGSSLNQFALTGPKLQKDILDILLKMRTKRIVVGGDISKMFLQIKITDNDRNYVRFLWRDKRTERLTVCQFSSLVFGLSCSPFLANAVIQDLANRNAQVNPMASYTLKNDIYVDDVFIYADTADEALENLRQVTNTLEQGSFKLTKFFSNSPIVCKAIPSEELNPKALLHLKPHEQKGKALGVAFHTNTDELVFQVHALTNQWKSTPIETKRSVLSKLAGIFDPLGLVAPQTIRLKICMQNIWKRGNINWNDTLPTELQTEWAEAIRALAQQDTLGFPRYIGSTQPCQRMELHIFCDASEKAYATCIYARCILEDEIRVTLLIAKAKVAPTKPMTLPRLELMACRIGVTLQKRVLAIMEKVNSSTFYTDSMIALHWINSAPENLKVFVSNRVKEIQAHTSPAQWTHINTKSNPADIPSRGLVTPAAQKLWLEGPPELKESHWNPSPLPSSAVAPPEAVREIKQPKISGDKINCTKYDICNLAVTQKSNLLLGSLNIERFNSYQFIVNTTCYVLKFIRQLPNYKNAPPWTVSHQRKAMEIWIRQVQQETWPTLQTTLTNQAPLPRSHQLWKFVPFLNQQGLICMKGRLSLADQPIRELPLLPGDPRIVQLYIQNRHQQLACCGLDQLQAQLRQQVWILGGKRTLRSAIAHCRKCFKDRMIQAQVQQGQLPAQRSTFLPPFTRTGLDYAGPLIVKQKGEERLGKRYILLFTCMVTRAIHLEVTRKLDTDETLTAITKFAARRGIPQLFMSDNAKSFQQSGEFLTRLTEKGITWIFIPPYTPHHGGAWERLVRTVKTHLRRTVGTAMLTDQGLETSIVQIEGILNSRPIGCLHDDPNSLEPLTPGHFLIGKPLMAMPLDQEPHQDVPFRKAYKHRQQVMKRFESRWRNEYLTSLQSPRPRGRATHPLTTGQIVLMKPLEKVIRQKWPMAKVIETHPGPDGIVRVVTLQTAKKTVKRGIGHVYYLEQDARAHTKDIEPPAGVKHPRKAPQKEERNSGADKTKQEQTMKTEESKDCPKTKTTRGGRQVRPPSKFSSFAMTMAILSMIALGTVVGSPQNSTRFTPPEIVRMKNGRLDANKSPMITKIEKPYMMERLGTTYKGISMGHLSFSIKWTELTHLTYKVEQRCNSVKQVLQKATWDTTRQKPQRTDPKAWRKSNVEKVTSAFDKCKGVHLRLDNEDEQMEQFLGKQSTKREKRFFATMGAFAIGGALTFAAEQISHLFQTGGSYDNEKTLAHHIEKLEKAIHDEQEGVSHFEVAILESHKLKEKEEMLDAFLIRTDQIIDKLVEDHRDLVHKIEDLFIKILQPTLIPHESILRAIDKMNKRLREQDQQVLLRKPNDVFNMPFSILNDPHTIVILIHVPIGNPQNSLELFKIHTLPFSIGTQGTVTQLRLPPYFVMNKEVTLYSSLSEEEVNKCIRLGEVWLCGISVLQKQFEDNCAASLLAGRSIDRKVCGVDIVGKYPAAVQLNPATFLLHHPQLATLYLKCAGNRTTQRTLQGTFVAHLEGCEGNTDFYQVLGQVSPGPNGNQYLHPEQEYNASNLLNEMEIEQVHNLKLNKTTPIDIEDLKLIPPSTTDWERTMLIVGLTLAIGGIISTAWGCRRRKELRIRDRAQQHGQGDIPLNILPPSWQGVSAEARQSFS